MGKLKKAQNWAKDVTQIWGDTVQREMTSLGFAATEFHPLGSSHQARGATTVAHVDDCLCFVRVLSHLAVRGAQEEARPQAAHVGRRDGPGGEVLAQGLAPGEGIVSGSVIPNMRRRC